MADESTKPAFRLTLWDQLGPCPVGCGHPGITHDLDWDAKAAACWVQGCGCVLAVLPPEKGGRRD
jgi:hypothetical protein